jgi:alkanesulfonate monooxygenase SsuD/methylene tetrahydromethanopterin reductase-like flavin-dependent oxidoreductase (luciferase family)
VTIDEHEPLEPAQSPAARKAAARIAALWRVWQGSTSDFEAAAARIKRAAQSVAR